jgi:hypothetical protein
MKIGPIQNGGGPSGPSEDERRAAEAASDRNRRPEPQDSVEISPSGRSLSEQMHAARPADGGAPSGTETERDDIETTEEIMDARQERIELARRRAESGYYNNPAVKSETARRITDDFAG